MKYFIVLFFSLLHLYSFGQKGDIISKIKRYREATVNEKSNAGKLQMNDSLIFWVEEFLDLPGSLKTSLSDIRYMGDLTSPDMMFRIVTWNISLSDGTYQYYCYIQKPNTNKKGDNWFKLNDKHLELNRIETRALDAEKWYGCLYYNIIPFEHNKTTMYALLGWEGNNKFSNKKVIECLYFDRNGTPRFGKTVFKTERLTKRRVVFEYSKEAYLLLRYDPKLKSIIFNRLEPMKPELEGLYSFYRPTLTYDSFKIKKGQWLLTLDVKPENLKNNKTYNTPKNIKVPKK